MLTLSEMQLLAEAIHTTEDTRKELNKMVSFFLGLSTWEEDVDYFFCQPRQLPISIARQQKVFFVNEDMQVSELPEVFRDEALGMVRGSSTVYAGRLVYPVMDVKGDVMGFCGWDNAETPKYLDSRNQGYKAKQTTFYGMEKLREYYMSKSPVYAVEGIVCCLYLRSIGMQAFALLGSSISPYVLQILRRFGSRLVMIPDNDVIGKDISEIASMPAGEHTIQIAKKYLPKARIIQSVLEKDVDDTRINHPEQEYIFQQELRMAAVNPLMPFKTLRVRKV